MSVPLFRPIPAKFATDTHEIDVSSASVLENGMKELQEIFGNDGEEEYLRGFHSTLMILGRLIIMSISVILDLINGLETMLPSTLPVQR